MECDSKLGLLGFRKAYADLPGQERGAIVLTARAYVASTYNEALFKSDVYQAFLDFADKNALPLAAAE